ncbi:MAG: small subunit ribosomal protein S6 [Saprospiraceae bacterium]|jgi:small subunit ribosomal protein S6
MRHYETTLILDPVLQNDEVAAAVKGYEDLLKEMGAEIVHVEKWGLRQLAYPINKRSSGLYFTIEFAVPTGEAIEKLELQYRRSERVMRFLTIALDKHGVKYNADKRAGLIGKKKPAVEAKADSKKK